MSETVIECKSKVYCSSEYLLKHTNKYFLASVFIQPRFLGRIECMRYELLRPMFLQQGVFVCTLKKLLHVSSGDHWSPKKHCICLGGADFPTDSMRPSPYYFGHLFYVVYFYTVIILIMIVITTIMRELITRTWSKIEFEAWAVTRWREGSHV